MLFPQQCRRPRLARLTYVNHSNAQSS